MPLSEEELRLLEQMERALIEEDPKLASTLQGTAFRRSARRRAILAGVVFAIGIALLMTGVIIQVPVVGILGFVVMLGSATLGLAALRGKQAAVAASREATSESRGGFTVIDGGRSGRSRGSKPARGSFMTRMEERWRRRREGDGRW